MRQKVRLTKAVIDRLQFNGKTPKAKCVYWDSEIAGYGVRVYQSGAKSYVFNYRVNGRERYIVLGEVGILTPDQARQKAMQARGDVSKGQDLQAEKRRAARGESVLHMCRLYIDLHARPHNKSWRKDLERMELYIVGRPEETKVGPDNERIVVREAVTPPLPHFKSLKAKSVTRQDIVDLQHAIGVERGNQTTANRVIALLRSMFNQARLSLGILDQGHPNPCEGVKAFPERKRARFLRKDGEAQALVQALNREPNVYARAAIFLYLLTGFRKEELLKVRWEPHVLAPTSRETPEPHVDLETRAIYQHDTKGGRPFGLPLSEEAYQIFAELRRSYRQAGNPYVFCGAVHGRHLVNISKPWGRVKKDAGVPDVTIHDLRRTVGSWTVQRGGSLVLVAAMLNQSNTRVAEVYGRFDVDPLRAGLEAQGQELKRLTGGVNLLPAPEAEEVQRPRRKSKGAVGR
jgi:integrase